MDDPPPARWLSFKELAAETGLSPTAAEARARRMVRAGRWRHRVDNDPPNAGRVLVTPADIEAMRGHGAKGRAKLLAQGQAPEIAQGDAQGGMDPSAVNTLLGALKASYEREAEGLRQVAGELRHRSERAEGEVDRLREAERASAVRADAERQARERAEAGRDAAEAELAAWTAGGPLARALRALAFRRGR
jgi:DNA-binding Lrp family transcriptional regulator